MANRIARRLIKDEGIASAEDYASIGAMAILNAGDKPPALLWVIGKRAIIDEHRRVVGRKGNMRAEGNAATEYLGQREQQVADIRRMSADEQIALSVELHKALGDRYRPLSNSEIRLIALLAQGYSVSSAARHLGLSTHTTSSQVKSARRKVHALTSAHLVAKAIKYGYINLDDV